jgi:hypothetical protein
MSVVENQCGRCDGYLSGGTEASRCTCDDEPPMTYRTDPDWQRDRQQDEQRDR